MENTTIKVELDFIEGGKVACSVADVCENVQYEGDVYLVLTRLQDHKRGFIPMTILNGYTIFKD